MGGKASALKNIDKKKEREAKELLIIKDSYSKFKFINIFVSFISINNGVLYLVYTNEQKSLIFYNLIDNIKMNEIKNSHATNINNIRYFFDKINNRDLILSISFGNLKIWNIDSECIININEKSILTACILNNKNQNYILSITKKLISTIRNRSMKTYNLDGNLVKEIDLAPIFGLNDLPSERFIDCYYDINYSKYYIILCNDYSSFSFDYNEQRIYQEYKEYYNDHERNVIIKVEKNIVKLIESIKAGKINIWDFHSGEFLFAIYVKDNYFLYDICLWKENYLFIGCSNNTIKLLDLNDGKIIYEFKTYKDSVISIKIINHPKYGECLLSHGYLSGGIQLWDIKYILIDNDSI